MARQTQVIAGNKGPREARMDELKATEAYNSAQHSVATAEPTFEREAVTYQSKWLRLRISVWPEQLRKDEFGNVETVRRAYSAQFENGIYVNNYSAEESDEANQKRRDYIDKKLQSHKMFARFDGKKIPENAGFWLASDLRTASKTRAKASAADTMKRLAAENPEEFKAFLSELETSQAKTHDLPKREAIG